MASNVCELYVAAESWLLCGEYLGPSETVLWRQHIPYMDDDLLRGPIEILKEACQTFLIFFFSDLS